MGANEGINTPKNMGKNNKLFYSGPISDLYLPKIGRNGTP